MPDRVKRFIIELSNKPDFDDVEKLYDCIDQTINIKKNYSRVIVSNMQYQSPNFHIGYSEIVDGLEELKSIIRRILLDSFRLKPESVSIVREVYDSLWSAMKDSGSDAFQILTTNYDLVIERYCDEAGWELVNGFIPTISGLQRRWSEKWSPDTDKPLYLTKLHGSVSWQKESNSGEVIEIGAPGIRIADDDVLILPTIGPKEYVKTPFLPLISHFQEVLSAIDVLVVIGFSYRDTVINEIIRNQLDKGMVLISISPTPDDILRIFPGINQTVESRIGNFLFKRTRVRVFAYEKEFGPNTIDDICNALTAIYRKPRLIGRRRERMS